MLQRVGWEQASISDDSRFAVIRNAVSNLAVIGFDDSIFVDGPSSCVRELLPVRGKFDMMDGRWDDVTFRDDR